MSYTTLLTPRPEVLNDEVEGIIDLANIGNRKKLENKPSAFFDLTYPTEDLKRVLADLHRRFNTAKPGAGLFLFEGLKGSGKSHLLLFIYHLFNAPKHARAWLSRHGLQCDIPADAEVVINKFTDAPILSIWDFIYFKLHGGKREHGDIQPGLDEIEAVIGDRRLVLILDELEQGIRILPTDAIKHQNIAFLQMLSEWSNRTDQVTMFASIYTAQEEPGSTLKRGPRCEVRFQHVADRSKVVLHRLFSNFAGFSPTDALPTIESYLSTWHKHGSAAPDELRDKMLDSFPFSWDMMDLMLRRVPARGGFQNVRGALGFLAHLVRLTYETADLVTPAHADIRDREVGIRLGDLEVGPLHINSEAAASRDRGVIFAETYLPEITRHSQMHYSMLGREARDEAVAGHGRAPSGARK